MAGIDPLEAIGAQLSAWPLRKAALTVFGNIVWIEGPPPLHFVRCSGKLLQCSRATFVVLLPPTLGVSSLDLGRLQPRAASFFVLV